MNKFIVIALIIHITTSACAPQCLDCQSQDNRNSCISCPAPTNIYIFSCQFTPQLLVPFVIITVVITALHIFMLFVGIGVYRTVFENIQLVALINWRYSFGEGIIALQGTNLATVKNNSFPDTFGYQFIAVMCVLGVFWLLLIFVKKIPHAPTATLVTRKKIIFPTRIITFIFNILLYSSLIQVTTGATEPEFKAFAFVLAILALIKLAVVLMGLAVTSNWKNFEVDDPLYYVLLEEMTSKKWYAKNNVLFSLIFRGITITSFVVLFQQPTVAGIIMTASQLLYALYVLILLRFTKLRYYIVIAVSEILTIGIIVCLFLGGQQTLGSSGWSSVSTAYMILFLILIVIFFVATVIEIGVKKFVIAREWKRFYKRYIFCEKDQDSDVIFRYDENSQKEKVVDFRTNLIYEKELQPKNQVAQSNRESS